MNLKRVFHADNWLKTPADRDVIVRWTRDSPEPDPARRYVLGLPPDLAPTDGAAWEFLALGDTGDADAAGPGVAPQDAVGRALAADTAPPVGAGSGRLVLHVGDVVYMTGEHRLYERNFRRPYAPFLTRESTVNGLTFRVPFLPVPGNHDYYDLGGWAKWVARVPLLAPGLRAVAHELFAFGLPEGGSDMGRAYMDAFIAGAAPPEPGPLPYLPGVRTGLPNRYYQFTCGGVDFFALDSNTLDAPAPSADAAQVHRDAQSHIRQLEGRAQALDTLLRREQRARAGRRQAERDALAHDAARLALVRERANEISGLLTGLEAAVEAARGTEAGLPHAEAARVAGVARERWQEGAAVLAAAASGTTEAALRALDLLDEASDEVCRSLLSVETYLGTLPAGDARARLTAASDAVERAQTAFAEITEPRSREGDARLHALSEEAMDLQRELALEQRRERYRPDDYDSAQFAWLEAALAASERERPGNWRIVYLHHPLYTCIGNHCERPDVIGLRENVLSLLQARGRVHLILSGHSHAFEWFRSDALPNTGVFVTGGGGQITLRPSVLEPERLRRNRGRLDALRAAGVRETASAGAGPAAPGDGDPGPLYHYLRVIVHPDALEVRPVGIRWLRGDGRRSYRREAPMPVYHTPYLPAAPDAAPFTARRLEAVIVRRDAPPEARWAD